MILFVFFTATTQARFTERTEPYQVKHFKNLSATNLQVTTAGGDVQVIGTEARDASVAVLVTDLNGNFHKPTIEKALKNYVITIKQEKNVLVALAERKLKTQLDAPELRISFRVNLPRKIHANVNSQGGAIALSNLKGQVAAYSAGGPISLCQFSGVLKAESLGGAISLNEAEGSLEMASAGGSITLKKVSGDILARSAGGNIVADVRELGKYLTLETSEGSLKATIPGNRGLNVELSGSAVKTVHDDLKGVFEKDKITGSIYGGGVPVKLRSGSGVTELKYRS